MGKFANASFWELGCRRLNLDVATTAAGNHVGPLAMAPALLLLLLLLPLLGPGARAQLGAPFLEPTMPISALLDSRAEKAEPIFRQFNISAVTKGHKPYEVLLFLCSRLRSRSFPFVGSYNQRISSYLRSFTSRYQVPYFTWDDTPPPPPPPPGDSEARRRRRRRRRRWRRRSDWAFGRTAGPPFIVSVRPDLTFALRSFLKLHKWCKFGYVYTSDLGFERLQNIRHLGDRRKDRDDWDLRTVGVTGLEYLSLGGLQPNPKRRSMDSNEGPDSNPEQRIYGRLKHLDEWLRRFPVRNIVLDVNGKGNILRLLRVLQNLGMMRQEYHYLILDFGIGELPLNPYKFCGVNISGFQLLDYNDPQHIQFMQKWAKRTELLGMELHEIALLHDALNLSKEIERRFALGWALPSTRVKCFERDMKMIRFMKYSHMRSWPQADQIVRMLTSTTFPGITGELAFDENLNRQNYSVNLIHYSGRLGNSVNLGTWHNSNEHFETVENNTQTTTAEATNPNKTLRVVSIIQAPFLERVNPNAHPKPMKGKKNFAGYCADLAEEIFNSLPGYDYDIQLVEDGKYGRYSQLNASWNGMVGEVLSGKADIIIAPLTISSERARFLFFSEPFMTFGLSILMKKPEKTRPGTFSFMYPLSNYLWFAIGASTVCIGLGLYLIARISPFEWDNPPETRFSLFNSLWFSLAAFMHQGVPLSPTSPGSRIFSSVWWMFSIVIMAYYTANLAAFLTVERLITPIKEASDLVNKRHSTGIKFGTLLSGSTYEFFANSTMLPYTAIHEIMQANRHWYAENAEIGVERVRKGHGKYTFIMESKMSEYVIHRKPCDTMMAEDIFGNKEYGIAVSREHLGKSDLWEKINHAVLKLREAQKLALMVKEWWVRRGNCPEDQKSAGSRSLALTNVSGVFYILIVGLVMAMLWAFIETSVVVVRSRRKPKIPKFVRSMPRYADY